MPTTTYFREYTWPRLTHEQLDQAMRGERHLRWMSGLLPYRLNDTEAREFEQAKQRGYVITRGKRTNLHNAWFSYCELGNHPFIVVRLGSLYANVEIDLIGQTWKLSQEANDAIFGYSTSWFQRKGALKRGASVSGGRTCIVWLGVANEYADEIAGMMLAEALRCGPGLVEIDAGGDTDASQD